MLGVLAVIMSKAKVSTPKPNSGEGKSAKNFSTGNTSSANLLVRKESKKCEKGKSAVRRKVAGAGIPGMIVEEGAEIEAAAGIVAAALPVALLVPVISILILTKVGGVLIEATAAGATAAMKNPSDRLARVEATGVEVTGGAGLSRPPPGQGRGRLAVGNAAK